MTTVPESLALICTKLQRPRLRANLVARPRLLAQPQRGLNRKLTLISAQAGARKSTLLCQLLPLPLLRARGEMTELRAIGLRFTPEEMEAFLTARLGLDLARETVGVIEDSTEGWIMGLQRAALSMRALPDHDSFWCKTETEVVRRGGLAVRQRDAVA